jgi:hypothetical protein
MVMRYRVTNISNTPGFEGGPRPFFIVEGGRLLNPGDDVRIARVDPGTRLTFGLKVEDLDAPATPPAPVPPRMTEEPAKMATSPELEKSIEEEVVRVQSVTGETSEAEPALELDPAPVSETEPTVEAAPAPEPRYTGKRGRRS